MDDRLLRGVRRFWDQAKVETVYAAVLTAYSDATQKEVSITNAGFDGQQTGGTVVLDREAMAAWMDVLEFRLQELEDSDADLDPMDTGSPALDFSKRRVGT
jgi:hypothetical protein